ncbi:MAG: ABC transporter ATP-binding protein [Melioribacteraceae bacterium]|nr:ABC transporter ATP-binding protein [Melioribacteraceae bacterium]
MIDYKIKIESLRKVFGRRLIFDGINIELNSGLVYGVSGPNGSGKSTFVKLISGLISPTKGKVIHSLDELDIIEEKLHNHLGFVSPYLVMYDEFSGLENIEQVMKIRGLKIDYDYVTYLFDEVNLKERKFDLVKEYSSGMKQRLKFVFALVHNPELLIFDEPTSNLDVEGKEKVYKLIKEEKEKGKLIIVASNEIEDLKQCDSTIDLINYKKVN